MTELTKGDVLTKSINRNAQRKLKRLGWVKRCTVCGYDKAVHVCHITPIKDFSDATPISEINHVTNLIYLCPNHHSEMDSGLLNIKDFI